MGTAGGECAQALTQLFQVSGPKPRLIGRSVGGAVGGRCFEDTCSSPLDRGIGQDRRQTTDKEPVLNRRRTVIGDVCISGINHIDVEQ